MLNQVADGVWVRQSEWVSSNAIAVRGEGGLILVDPGIDGSDLNQLADDVDRLGIPVVAGFSTHPHWDHLLWHSRFGDVPRYATPTGAQAAREARERAQTMAAESGRPLNWSRTPWTMSLCTRVCGRVKLGWNFGNPGGVVGWSQSPARTADGVSGCARFARFHAARAPASSRCTRATSFECCVLV